MELLVSINVDTESDVVDQLQKRSCVFNRYSGKKVGTQWYLLWTSKSPMALSRGTFHIIELESSCKYSWA